MRSHKSISAWLLILFLLAPLKLVAEDIDLFVGRSLEDSDPPNVLIVLDNTANWGPDSKFQAQKEAMIEVFSQLPDGSVNLGLMMYTETGDGDSNTDGGYVRAAIRNMDATNRLIYRRMFAGPNPGISPGGLDVVVDRSNSGKSGLVMAEAYLYYSGGTPYSGNNKNKTDYSNNTYVNSNASCCADSHPLWALAENALATKSGTEYNSPVDPDSCGDNYIIFIGNGPASDSNSDKVAAETILRSVGGTDDDVADIPLEPDSGEASLADEWAAFMLESPLEIQTFAIDVNIVSQANQCDNRANLGWSAVMESMATKIPDRQTYFKQCGTSFDPGQFEADFLNIFEGILARNSVFASVALPAAANEQSTFLNQVYIGMFRPSRDGLPRWWGNLKQYKIGINNFELSVVDANDEGLVETDPLADNAGFVQGCARSYWTPATADTYWDYLYLDNVNGPEFTKNDPVQNCGAGPYTADAGSNSPDGQIVEKGGQGYVLRAGSPASRTILTCSATLATCNTNGLVTFNNANVPDNSFGEADAAEKLQLLAWAYGADVDDEDGDTVLTDMRPSAHHDVVHSQPVAMDFADDPLNPEIVVFYGGNDGVLRAINGDQTSPHASPFNTTAAGQEFWGFMPSEFYPGIKRNRDNSIPIEFPSAGPTEGQGVAGAPKDYGMDGPLTAYRIDLDDNGTTDERWLFASMRRAGRVIYSFDVTNRGTPTLNWKIGCPNLNNDTSCSTGMDNIGQTWSAVALTYATGYDPINGDGILDPLLLVGGGYDECEDYDNGTDTNHNCSTTKGNSIYVLDATDGSVVRTFATARSVPGNLVVVPVADNNPAMMFAYAVDTGGNVYRISGSSGSPDYIPEAIGSTDPADWVITQIASLGCDDVSTCTANRKFQFGPDVIKIPDSDLIGILVGSGEREKPLLDYGAANGVQNYFYSLVDQPLNPDWLDDSLDPDTPCDGNDLICQDALTTVATGDDFDPDLQISTKGWKLPMRTGEQVVTGSITVDNIVNFSTHIPAVPESCDAEYGEATAYNVEYLDAQGSTTQFLGGGLVPTPVAGKVLIDGVPVPFCIGCGGEGSPIGAGKVGGGITWTQPRSRVFWNIDEVDP